MSGSGMAITPAARDGWYVRICRNKTDADQIHLELGVGNDKASRVAWRTWMPGDASEIDLPVDVRQAPEIWIRATASPKGRQCVMCLCYLDHVVKRMGFRGEEEHREVPGHHDKCEC